MIRGKLKKYFHLNEKNLKLLFSFVISDERTQYTISVTGWVELESAQVVKISPKYFMGSFT